MKITGTFLDEISHDIPSASWGRKEWDRDFRSMAEAGIDTVILIRAGYRDQCTFDSASLKKNGLDIRPVYLDLVDLFLELAEKYSMDFFFGIYDSGKFWHEGKHSEELDLNRSFTEEVIGKYGSRKAFKGWYLSHELTVLNEDFVSKYAGFTAHLRALKDMPILISPYVKGPKQFDEPITLKEHERQWDRIFGMFSGKVDIAAFQDGHMQFLELQDYLRVNKKLADKHGLRSWSNVETFERGMPINFLPIAWPNLRFKLEAAEKAGVEKLITFEFSHFLSPNSMYPSAHNLFKRYMEYQGDK